MDSAHLAPRIVRARKMRGNDSRTLTRRLGLSATNPLRRQRLYSKETDHAPLLVNIIATMVFTVIFVFGSLACFPP
jgi:hypothetical protein